MVNQGQVMTSLPYVQSRYLDTLLYRTRTNMANSGMPFWDYLVEQGLMVVNLEGEQASPVVGTTYDLATYDIATSPGQAFAVYGGRLAVRPENTASGANLAETTGRLTYYQPSPPAGNSTTPADESGNLQLRNVLMQMETVSYMQTSGMIATGFMDEFWFRRPPLIVGPALVVQGFIGGTGASGTDLTIHVSATVLGKYIPISTQQYVNLVAIATAEAILPPSIFG